MRKLGLFVALVFVLGTAYSYSSQSVQVQDDEQVNQLKACNSVSVGEVDYDTYVEDGVLMFGGFYCAPNIGYNLEVVDIAEENGDLTAYANISAPDGVSGPAITPVRFNATEELEPGNYNLEVSIEVEGETVVSDRSEISVEGERKSLITMFRDWFLDLF